MTSATNSQSRRVVVGVDGSESSQNALRWGAYIAAASGAVLEAVSVWNYPTTYGWSALPTDWVPKQDMDKGLTSSVDEVFGANRPVGMKLEVGEGSAAEVLITQSEGALMLVVGSRGHGGFAGLLLGSVSAKVAEHATCPVLVVHGDQVPPELAS